MRRCMGLRPLTPKSVLIHIAFGDLLEAELKCGRGREEGVQDGKGPARAGHACPPVPGPHNRNQTDQVFAVEYEVRLGFGVLSF
jgi:hypothetical protein